jgi:gliding motility-associated-like protein
MRGKQLKRHLLFLCIFFPLLNYAQQNQADCEGALVVCGNTAVDVLDSVGDVLDFNDSDNDLGCHITGESSSTWIYFRFRDDMPPNSDLEFVITPYETVGEVDYDFALYAADTPCDSLGSPVRCSYSWAFSNNTFNCGFCPQTGLGNGETDFSENPFGNGFVASISTNPGQGFYLYINEFYDSSVGSISDGFTIDFGGEAANYFDCGANPNCDQVTVDAGKDTLLCSGDPSFQLSANTTFTTGFETYTWTGASGEEVYLEQPDSANTAVQLPEFFSGQLIYYLEVASEDCSHLDTIIIDVAPSPDLILPTDTTFCEGDSIILSAGAGFETYTWSNDSTSSSIEIDTSGVFYVTVTSAGGLCSIIDSVNATAVPAPMPVIVGQDTICIGDTLSLDGGSGYLEYTWNGVPGNQFYTVTAPGNYTLLVTDSTGCSGSSGFQVSALPEPSVSISGPVGLCPASSGTLDAGSGYSTYLWSNDSTTQTINISTPGIYSVTVTNASGCTDVASINIQSYDSPTPEIIGDTLLCFGENQVLSPATPHNSYTWSTNENTPAILTSGTNTYYLTVTNSDGCVGVDSISVVENDSIAVDVGILLNEVLCAGDTVFINATPGYNSYQWSNGVIGPLSFADTQGTYTVTVTDNIGCSETASIFINENPLPIPDISGPAGLCPGETVLLSIDPFDAILWDDNTSGNTRLIDSAGTYAVTVTDTLGCVGTDSIEVATFSAPIPIINGPSTVCEDANTLLSVSQPFTSYDWSTGQLLPAILVDSAGIYSITVTNTDGCPGSDTLVITEVAGPVLNLADSTSICSGDNTTIGIPDIYESYLWNTSDTTSSIPVSQPGDYTLSVTDINGCQTSEAINVVENPLPNSGLNDNFQYCIGDSITISANAGLVNYEWSISANGNSITVNTPGTYTLTITDANSCSSIDTFNVIENQLPAVSILGDDTICEGDSSTLTTSSSYATYLWQDLSTDSLFTATEPGIYTVTITDTNGCAAEASINVNELMNPVPVVDSLQSYCENDSLTLEAASGYVNYIWSTGEIASTINVQTPDDYSFTVTDNNGCRGDATIRVVENPLPNPTLQGNTYFCYQDSTSISITDGDIISYNWSTGDTSSTEIIDMAGFYSVEVTDINGCQNIVDFQISEQAEIIPNINGDTLICEGTSTSFDAPAGFNLYSWNTGDTSATISADSAAIYSLTVTDSFGCEGVSSISLELQSLPDPMLSDTTFLCEDGIDSLMAVAGFNSYLWSTNDTTSTITIDAPGVYSVTVTDQLGCMNNTDTEVLTIDAPSPIVTGDLTICPGLSSTLSVTDPYESYLWSTNDTTASITVNTPGFYQVTVTNDAGCLATTNIFVFASDTLEVAILGATDVCSGDSITLTSFTNQSTVVYEWSTGSNDSSITISESGEYILSVSNALGCTISDTVTINIIPLPDPDLPDTVGVCENDNILLTTSGDFASYEWQDGNQDSTYTVSQGGWYTLDVVDNFGCEGTDSTFAFVQPLPDPTINGATTFCAGDSLSLSISDPWESIHWSTGDTLAQTLVLSLGSYFVTVEDALGCVGIDTIQIDTFTTALPMISGPNGICPQEQITLEASSGFDTYTWSTGAITQNILADSAGTYSISVTDANGCQTTTSIVLTGYDAPQFDILGADSICTGESTVFQVDGVFDQYQWSTSEQADTILVNLAGDYSITVTDMNGCEASDTIRLITIPLPSPDITGDNLICDGETTTLSLTEIFASYEWSGTNQNPFIVADTAGIYTVTVSNDFGCQASTSFEVVVEALPQPDIIGSGGLCEGTTSTLSADMPYDTLWWNTGVNTPDIVIDSAGLYTLFVQSTSGCMGMDTLTVKALELPDIEIIGQPTLCPNDSLSLEVITNGQQILWSTSDTTTTIMISQEGDYSVEVTGTNSCIDTAMITIVEATLIEVSAGEDQSINCIEESVPIGGEGSPLSGILYEWSGPGIVDNNKFEFQPTVSEEGLYILTATDTLTGCSAIPDSILVIDLRYEPTASILTSDTIDCTTPTVTLDGAGSSTGIGIIYQWLDEENNIIPNATDIQLVTSTSGLYSLLVIDTLTGCQALTSTFLQSNFNAPDVSINPASALSCEEETSLLQATVQPLSEMIMIQWLDATENPIPGATNSELEVSIPGWYYLLATDLSTGCESIDSMLVEDNTTFPVAEAGNDQELNCVIEEVQLNGTGSTQGAGIQYEWINSSGVSIGNNIFIDVEEEDTYFLVVTNQQNGCFSIDSVEVSLSDAFILAINATAIPPLCEGDQNGVIVIDTIIGGTPPFLYSIEENPLSNQQVFTGLGAGNYTLLVEDLEGCELSTSISLEDGNTVVVELGNNMEINLGDEILLNAQVNLNDDEISQVNWMTQDTVDCDNCLSWTTIPLQSNNYAVAVVDTNGCSGTDMIQVFVNKERQVFIPNAFSPNLDGANDLFMIFAGDDVEEIESLNIYDRWGENVFSEANFQPNDPKSGWDGFFRGVPLNNCVLVYSAVIRFKDGEKEVFKGDISIVR